MSTVCYPYLYFLNITCYRSHSWHVIHLCNRCLAFYVNGCNQAGLVIPFPPATAHQRVTFALRRINRFTRVFRVAHDRTLFFLMKNKFVSVDSEIYCAIMQIFLGTEPRRLGRLLRNGLFQQSGAKTQGNESINLLIRKFWGLIITRSGDIPWPERCRY
jgi:hypothetical protein